MTPVTCTNVFVSKQTINKTWLLSIVYKVAMEEKKILEHRSEHRSDNSSNHAIGGGGVPLEASRRRIGHFGNKYGNTIDLNIRCLYHKFDK